jgi:hypothetical protein
VARRDLIRLVLGIAVSVVFLAVVLLQVDLARTADAIARASLPGLGVALGIVLIDLLLRALRWHVLLLGIDGATERPPYRLAFGYLMLGFAANFVLPARLGDIARAVLAAGRFGVPRLAMFGTVALERVSDGVTMLVLAIGSSFIVASATELRELTGYALILAAVGIVGLVVGWFLIARSALASTRVGTLLHSLFERVSAGAGALRRPRSAVAFFGLTVLLATTATLVAAAVTRAVGVELTPVQTVLFLSGIALSLAIPAAPGAIGTYELFGTAIITGLGYTPEQGLATIFLMRVITTFPPALLGVAAILVLHVRPEAITHSADQAASR